MADFNPLIDLYGNTVANELNPQDAQLVDALQRQQMDQGLFRGVNSPITYSGPVAGYSGPLRASDVPYDPYKGEDASVPVYHGTRLSPQTVQARGLQELERVRNVPFGDSNLGNAMDVFNALPKNLGQGVNEGILEKLAPGLMSNVYNRRRQEKMDDFEERRKIMREQGAAPAGTYLDEKGNIYSPQTGSDILPKSTYYRKGSPEEKTLDASHMINTHVDRTIDLLGSIKKGDNNRFSQYLSTQLSQLKNDPNIATLTELMGPATALAVGQAYAASGSQLRGGTRLAEMFKNGVYAPGDTLKTSLTKLRNLEEINLANAQNRNLHGSAVDQIKDRISTIDGLLSGKASGGTSTVQMKAPDGSTRAVPKDRVEEFKAKGAVVEE